MKNTTTKAILKTVTVLILFCININGYACTSEEHKHTDINIADITKSAINNNDASNQLFLGMLYFTGKEVKKDYSEAFQWFSKSFDQGVSEAATMLAIMHLQGLGVKEDRKKAEELFVKAKTMQSIN